jgi:hypothetical protein
MRVAREIAPAGELHLKVIRGKPKVPASSVPGKELTLEEIVRYGAPQQGLPEEVNRWRRSNFRHLFKGARKILAARVLKVPHVYSQLSLVHIRADGSWLDLGLASMRVVTDTGAGFIVDAWQNTVELENMKYHGLGTTGTGTAEAASQTALGAEATTEYNPNSTRATGSTTEASQKVFRTVGTNTVDASLAVAEHGIFDQAATGGGVMLDRSAFSVVNLASGDSLQTTYDFTINSGS